MMPSLPPRALSYSLYRDRVLAGWLGKSIGGVIGARLEGHKELKRLTLGELWPGEIIPNDDLDLQILWLEYLQERNLHPAPPDLARFWQERCWYSFCEYGVFLNNLQRGIAPPLSGTWNNRFFKNSEGCPIRAEIWGYVAAGNPGLAAGLARLDGQLDHGETSIRIEQFLAALTAEAVAGGDLNAALDAGISVLPADCDVARAIPRVREIARRHGGDERQAWRLVIREYGHRNANDALANHALMLLALFTCRSDFAQAMRLCADFGWDTDCTASTLGALLGALGGTAALPPEWIEKLGPRVVCGIHVRHKEATFETLADDACRLGVEMSLSRNPGITFEGAPEVAVRPAPAPPGLRMETIFDDDDGPVLHDASPTRLVLVFQNTSTAPRNGSVHIDAPEGVQCDLEMAAPTLLVPPASEVRLPLTVRRKPAAVGDWLPDKNLFTATWRSAAAGTLAAHTFGLGGARQWQVYGPYWDMWDKTASPVCPYNNETIVGGPFRVGLTGDCYNHYVDPDTPYLDEARLLHEDLPEELPLHLERGEDILEAADLGGFHGQACYYFVRTLRSREPGVEAGLMIGRTGPVRVWVDGRLLIRKDTHRCWATLDDAHACVSFDGRPRRIVIKAARLADTFTLSLLLMRTKTADYHRGISNIHDCFEDLPSISG
ncbi:MAG: ADP-ribosylglycohydrolase family protein [Opitutaceae bacterium]|jgi:ADP-ribosylglycohydrolase|nr:ADP-ribosylglycohydrolase family protein [Opitutaceae bacterium]